MLTTLKIIQSLSDNDYTAGGLCELFNISPATLKRCISEARHLGAGIESYKENNTSWYRLKNWKACEKRVKNWIDLIEQENLINNK